MMEEQEPSNLRFFRVLMPGFTEKLSLPHGFIKQIDNHDSTGTAVLVSPNGKSWNVDIYKETDAIYIGGEGWKDLALAINLGVGYFLVLHYRENMVFDFCAFDLSTCEVAYPSISKTDERTKIKAEISDNENSDIIQEIEPTAASCKKQKRKGLSPDITKEPEPAATSCKRQKRQVLSAARGTKELRKLRSRGSFVVIIKESDLNGKRCFVRIPTEFEDLCDFSTRVLKLSLRDPKGQMWPVGLFHSLSRSVRISKGWRAFARANELKVGDRCFFELLPSYKDQRVMSVEITKNGEVVKTKNPPECLTKSKKRKNSSREVHSKVAITEKVIDPQEQAMGVKILKNNEVVRIKNSEKVIDPQEQAMSVKILKDNEVVGINNSPRRFTRSMTLKSLLRVARSKVTITEELIDTPERAINVNDLKNSKIVRAKNPPEHLTISAKRKNSLREARLKAAITEKHIETQEQAVCVKILRTKNQPERLAKSRKQKKSLRKAHSKVAITKERIDTQKRAVSIQIRKNSKAVRTMNLSKRLTRSMTQRSSLREAYSKVTIKEKLIGTQDRTMNGKIFKNGRVLRTKNPPKCLTRSTKQKKSSMKAHFKVVLSNYNIQRSYLQIPQIFAMSYLPKGCCQLTLRNRRNQKWVVAVSHRIEVGWKNSIVSISRGWLKFASDNKLKRGNICIFKKTSRGRNGLIMDVQVVKTRIKANN